MQWLIMANQHNFILFLMFLEPSPGPYHHPFHAGTHSLTSYHIIQSSIHHMFFLLTCFFQSTNQSSTLVHLPSSHPSTGAAASVRGRLAGGSARSSATSVPVSSSAALSRLRFDLGDVDFGWAQNTVGKKKKHGPDL